MADHFQRYGVEYQLDGSTWNLDIMATSEDDARRRLARAAAFGKVFGPVLVRIKVAPDWFGRLWQRLSATDKAA